MNDGEREKISFEAVILDPGGPGAYVEIPHDIEAIFGRKRMKIVADIEGQIYRGSIQRMGTECHVLIILKEIRQKIGKGIGDSVRISLWEDNEPRVVEIPAELAVLFEEDPITLEKFRALAYTHQREYAMYINEAKQAETRQRRAIKTWEELKGKVGKAK